jgi:hypothetical protein
MVPARAPAMSPMNSPPVAVIPVSVILQGAEDADAKPGGSFPVLDLLVADPPDANAHSEVAGSSGELVGQEVHCPIRRGFDAFESPPGDPPILHRVGPVLGADPDAVELSLPLAPKPRGFVFGREKPGSQLGGNHGSGCGCCGVP